MALYLVFSWTQTEIQLEGPFCLARGASQIPRDTCEPLEQEKIYQES